MLVRHVVALLVLWPTAVLGQVTGRFYIEKDTFALGDLKKDPTNILGVYQLDDLNAILRSLGLATVQVS